MKVKLEKLSKNEGGLRTSVVEGECDYLPYVGKRFLMRAPPLESGDLRIISTSLVQDVYGEGSDVHFNTENSHYRLSFL
jgi:hypothetical protein